MEMAEGVRGVAPEQVTTSQRVALTFPRGAGQKCGSQTNIKTQGIVHLSRVIVAGTGRSILLGNGLQAVTPQAPMANNLTTPLAMPSTISNSMLNSKSVPRHTSFPAFLVVILI